MQSLMTDSVASSACSPKVCDVLSCNKPTCDTEHCNVPSALSPRERRDRPLAQHLRHAHLAPERRSLLQHLELIGLCTKLDEPYLAAQHALEAATIHPKEPDVRLKAGMTLLEVGDDQGLVHLRAATDLDPGMAPKACAHAMRFLKERNMRAEMEAWGEVWSRARGQLSQEEVRNTPRIVLQGLAASSSG